MSKPTSSFDIFPVDAFSDNGEGEACAVGLRLPVAQRLFLSASNPLIGLPLQLSQSNSGSQAKMIL